MARSGRPARRRANTHRQRIRRAAVYLFTMVSMFPAVTPKNRGRPRTRRDWTSRQSGR